MVGRGTRTSNIEFYESPEIQTLEVGHDQVSLGAKALKCADLTDFIKNN